MKSPAEIRALAKERLEEAIILKDNKKFNGAFYLAGYAIELSLKAKICEKFDIPNLFEESTSIPGISELRKGVKTHDLLTLLVFSGLKNKYDTAKAKEKILFRLNSLLFTNWNESYRYKPCGFCKDADVNELITLLQQPDNLIEWIEKN